MCAYGALVLETDTDRRWPLLQRDRRPLRLPQRELDDTRPDRA